MASTLRAPRAVLKRRWAPVVSLGAWLLLLLGAITGLHDAVHSGKAARLGEVVGWSVMIVAMMLPAAAPTVGWLMARSLRRRRRSVALGFVAGFLGVWILAGAAVIALKPRTMDDHTAAVLALFAAALWYCSVARERRLHRCDVVRAPAIEGIESHFDCAGSGVRAGLASLVVCGPAMVPMLFDHRPLVMLAVAAVTLFDRKRPLSAEPGLRSFSAGCGLAATGIAVTLLPG